MSKELQRTLNRLVEGDFDSPNPDPGPRLPHVGLPMLYIIVDLENGIEYRSHILDDDLITDFAEGTIEYLIIRLGESTGWVPEFLDEVDHEDGDQTWIAIDEWPGDES